MLKNYIIYINLFALVALPIVGMHPLQRQAFHNHTSHHENVYSNHSSQDTENDSQQEDEKKAKEEEERKKLEELRSRLEEALLQERLQQEDTEKEKIEAEIHDSLALLHCKEEKRATAIFQIPDQSKVYDLTDQERERIKELFKVCSVENRGEYKVVKFQYKKVELLPQNREQAIYLLYSPHVKNKLIQSCPILKSPLNELQKNALDSKQKEKKSLTSAEKSAAVLLEVKKRLEENKKRQEGIFGATRVKTDKGHCTIEELKIGDLVACYDFKNKRETYSSITYADKLHLLNHIQITINNEIIQVAPEHKFYIHSINSWVKAKDLINNQELRYLLDPNIQEVKEVAEELDVIRISVNNQQNYYITNNNLLVHNFLTLDLYLIWGIAEGVEITWAVLGPTLTAAATGLIYWIAGKFCHADKIPHANIAAQQLRGMHHEVSNSNNEIFFKVENNTPVQQNNPKNNPADPGQSNKDPEKDKKDNEQLKEIMRDAKRGEETKGKSKIFEKKGTYEDALKDFDKLEPSNVKEINGKIGKVGDLPDGRKANVRLDSKDTRPTLEIFNSNNRSSIKFRYGTKLGF